MRYTEVNLEIINSLKAKGFKSVQFILQLTRDSMHATVEVIPQMEQDVTLDSISLSSSEIADYFNVPSPMTTYIIDEDYL